MSTAAISAKGIKFKIGATEVAEVLTVNGLSVKQDTVDVTSHASTSNWREYIATLKDAGEVSLELNYVPTETTHKNASGGLLYLLAQGTKQAFSIVFPDSGPTTWTFDGFVTSFSPSAPHDGKLGLSVTIKATGAPTLA